MFIASSFCRITHCHIKKILIPQFHSTSTINNFSTSVSKNPEFVPDKLFRHVELECRSADPSTLKSYNQFVTTSAQHLQIEVGNCWARRKAQHDRLTLLKSVHIYKKHRVQYERRTYFRFMQFHRITGSTLETFLEYIQRNIPEGVALKVSKVEIQKVPEHLYEVVKL